MTPQQVFPRHVLSITSNWATLGAQLSSTPDPTPARTAQRLGPSQPGGRGRAAARIVGCALIGCLSTVGEPAATTSGHQLERSTETPHPVTAPQPGVVATGTALGANGRALPGVVVLLRQLGDGREAGRVRADADGAFRLVAPAGEAFLIELHAVQGRLLAVSDPFAVEDGGIRSVDVRLRAEVPEVTRFFRNAATTAIRVASARGITAMGSSGRPVSPQ